MNSAPKSASKRNSNASNKPAHKSKSAHAGKSYKGNKPASKGKRTGAFSPRKPSFSMPAHIKIEKTQGLHERNKHHGRYDFDELVKALPELESVVILNPRGEKSVNFSDPVSVKLLNKALLALHYGVKHWELPPGYLCPPIPGRADYVHRVADLLIEDGGEALQHTKVHALDIGTGANAIYPIIASSQYGWRCKGSDIDPISVKTANFIAQSNPVLAKKVQAKLQKDSSKIFKGIIGENDHFDVTICNPPFHASEQEAEQSSLRKVNNLNINKAKRGQASHHKKETNAKLNFGGQKAELWCPGGEVAFIGQMAQESTKFAAQVLWFTSLVSKKETIPEIHAQLTKLGIVTIKVVEMQQGQKISRFIAWSFLSQQQRAEWFER